MGTDRKSKHARMGLLIDDRTNKRLPDLQTRRMPISGEGVRKGVSHRTMDRAVAPRVTIDVAVIYDNEENLWVAQCDLLGIVTEAETFESLTQQVQGLVPDMIAVNQIELGPRKPYLNFSHLEEAVI